MTVIAIDGSAASGKGTLSRRLAEHFGYAYLDTGLLYRAMAYLTLSLWTERNDISEEMINLAASSITPNILQNAALRDERVTERASILATIPKVRAALILQQRVFAKNPPDNAIGAILDGRDIGTVICPNATFKFFVDADIEVRAARRVKELLERGVEAIYARVLQDMKERDVRDSTRNLAPSVPAEDAFVIDTTKLNAEAAFTAALEFIQERDKSKA
tara:strand:- start:198 stop:851 length:654 start_codon:yes stop_codon:yes gene_type:complete